MSFGWTETASPMAPAISGRGTRLPSLALWIHGIPARGPVSRRIPENLKRAEGPLEPAAAVDRFPSSPL